MMAKHILSPPLSIETLHQFTLPTWIENIAIRRNGEILMTLLTAPEIHLLDPSTLGSTTRVHSFAPALSVTGIVELKEDVFYIAAGNYNTTTTWTNESGTYSIWEVDLTSYSQDSNSKVRKVTSLPEAGLLNGLEKFGDLILAADSEVGCVWKVDPSSGAYEIFIKVEEMKPPPPPGPQMGVNGIKIRDGYLYWSNTMSQLFCRIKLEGADEEVEVLEKECLIDDFCFDEEGNAWLAQNVGNTVAMRSTQGQVVVVGEGMEVAGATACAFGASVESGKQESLYVVTTGGLANPYKGKVEGGRVVALDTSGVQVKLTAL